MAGHLDDDVLQGRDRARGSGSGAHARCGCGNYIDLPDAYLSVSDALRAGGFPNFVKVEIRSLPSEHGHGPGGGVNP
jgi:hypothetical protein